MVNENAVDDFIRRHLHQENVHVANYDGTRRKILSLLNGGLKNFEVISDFDRTMSRHRHNGQNNPTCHAIFEKDPEVTTQVRKELKDLRDRYYPIEMNQEMRVADRIPHMLSWWQQTHDIIIKLKLHRDKLVETVKSSGLVLREYVREFTALLAENEIPILVFSAGLGDVICILLDRFGLLTSNVTVNSNFMKYDADGVVVGFQPPIIHTFNKTAATCSERVRKLPCVLLLGDTISDTKMADGACDGTACGNGVETVLRIGFLNDFVTEHLDEYMASYDIVIANDGSFEVPLALLKLLLGRWQDVADGVGDKSEKLNSN